MTTGEHPLQTYRRENQITQLGLAERLGVSKITILRWEKRGFPIPVKHLTKIEQMTGIAREALRPDIFRPAPVHMDAAS